MRDWSELRVVIDAKILYKSWGAEVSSGVQACDWNGSAGAEVRAAKLMSPKCVEAPQKAAGWGGLRIGTPAALGNMSRRGVGIACMTC